MQSSVKVSVYSLVENSHCGCFRCPVDEKSAKPVPEQSREKKDIGKLNKALITIGQSISEEAKLMERQTSNKKRQ